VFTKDIIKVQDNVSAPQIRIEQVELNTNNPFKKKRLWTRLRCSLCDEIVLGKAISNQKEWDKIRLHLKFRHKIIENEGIPIRLLSMPLFRRWLKLTRLKEKQGA